MVAEPLSLPVNLRVGGAELPGIGAVDLAGLPVIMQPRAPALPWPLTDRREDFFPYLVSGFWLLSNRLPIR